jgi:hypothetical protein
VGIQAINRQSNLNVLLMELYAEGTETGRSGESTEAITARKKEKE